jgi:hypothetical protein
MSLKSLVSAAPEGFAAKVLLHRLQENWAAIAGAFAETYG